MTHVGNRERERASVALRRHYAEGRLDDRELSERLELVLRARSRRELRSALRQLPRWTDLEQLAARLRHGALVAVLGMIWLMVSATLVVAFLVWVADHGARLGALVAFPLAWIVLSGVIYRRIAVSRRRLHRP